MRLLRLDSHDELGVTKDLLDNIPPYAILSHTWGNDDDEVTFGDMSKGTAKDKAGYDKIQFCMKQAARDGLHHFWIDSCCIDKSNSTELSEAINSMFRWYRRAARCYVYLTDVSTGDYNELDQVDQFDQSLEQKWELAFRQSRWFTRGWTLQELVAPQEVEFFSCEGKRLGCKRSLERQIHEITGIPAQALHESSFSGFSVEERLSWAEKRQTKREEDAAYSLLGIFDVHMPLIYGEGKKNAMARLSEQVERHSRVEAGLAKDTIILPSQRSLQADTEVAEKLGEICSWLSVPDPSSNYYKAHKQRQTETGLWLLESAEFMRWKTCAASRLWLHGIPGCGKTILSSTIVEYLLQHCGDDPSMVTVYFYFDFKDAQKQDSELMLRSLLYQLLQRSATRSEKILHELFALCKNKQPLPQLHVLLDMTRQMIQKFTHVYIVLDALDECNQRAESLGRMEILETVAGWQLQNLHVLMTSRKERDIESSLQDYVDKEDIICLQSDVVDKDIQRYVQQRLSDDKSLGKWQKDADVRQEIEAALMSGARGMFRWAACQLDMLGKCRNRMTLRKSLATLPPTLDQTYDRILSEISKEDAEYAMRILQWLAFAARPLSVEEVAEVVAIDAARDPAFNRDEVLEDPLDALNICSSLVTMTTENSTRQIVVLAHYSVKEYLVSDRIRQSHAKPYSMQEVKCHNAITKACLKYLLQFREPRTLSEETINTYALARYSAEFWTSHIQKTGDSEDETFQVAMDLLSKKNPAYLTWIQLCNPQHPWQDPDFNLALEETATPLYYTAILGLIKITRLLLEKGANSNVQGGYYGNALQAASFEGHKQVVEMLLNEGANVNAQGGFFGNALQAASVEGHTQVVEMLLNEGADVNAQGGHYGNALRAASFEGHEKVVEILLNKGADVAQGGVLANALQEALYRGHEQVVKILLNLRRDQIPVIKELARAAASPGNGKSKVELLLRHLGADFSITEEVMKAAVDNNDDGEVLRYLYKVTDVGVTQGVIEAAATDGKEDILHFLDQQAGAGTVTQDWMHIAQLFAAAQSGNSKTVLQLVEQSTPSDKKNIRGTTPLWHAAAQGHIDVVRVLLATNAVDVNAESVAQRTPIFWSAANGHVEVVKLLLAHGARQDYIDEDGRSPLAAAQLWANKEVVDVLLNYQAGQSTT